MSKETAEATICPGCENAIYYWEYHKCSAKGQRPQPTTLLAMLRNKASKTKQHVTQSNK